VIGDKSQGSVATRGRCCWGLLRICLSETSLKVETTVKIGQRLAKFGEAIMDGSFI